MSKIDKVDELFWKILEIRKKVDIGEKLGRAITDPIEMYYKVLESSGGLMKWADEDLKKLLKIAIEGREFSKAFSNRSRCADATWLIEHLTQGSAGASEANKEALLYFQELKKHCIAVKSIAEIGNDMVYAVALVKNIDIKEIAKALASTKLGGDMIAISEIKKANSFTISWMSKLAPEIETAIGWLKVM